MQRGRRARTAGRAVLFNIVLALAMAAQNPAPAPGASLAETSPVYLNQAGLSEAVRPASLRLGEYHSADLKTLVNASVSAVSWSSWGGTTAEGSGQALIQWTDATTGLHHQERATLPVVVSAAGLRSCGGISVYTSLAISPASGAQAPPHFAQVQGDRNVLPCAVHAGGYVGGQEERHNPNGCFFKGLRELVISPPFSLFYCALRWKGWGGSTTSGIGVARIGFKQYGLRVRLSRVLWCRQWTISYTQEKAEIWGAGEPLIGQGNVSSGQAARLKALIGRSGQPHKSAHESMPGGC
jgi:hypothetical protein